MTARAAALSTVILPVGTALAAIFDKIEETREDQWTVTCILLVITALAAASGWRRAWLLWPVTLIWSQIVFWTAWEWFAEIRQEGTSSLLWRAERRPQHCSSLRRFSPVSRDDGSGTGRGRHSRSAIGFRAV